MAGVGFELKKLFKEKSGYVELFKAYAVSSIVTQGPMVLCILMLFILRFLMIRFKSGYKEQEIFLITITYIMIFSMILANTVLFFISRFISDCIYQKKFKDILSAFYGISVVLLLIGGTCGYIYIFSLNINIIYKIITLSLFCMSLIIWVQMTFLSAIKQYGKILKGFFFSIIISTVIGLILMYINVNPLIAGLLSYAISYFVIMVSFMKQLLKFYPLGKINIFVFLPELDKNKILLFIGFFMTLGLYGHNFVLWGSEYGIKVLDRMKYCLIYDIPAFFACLTIVPMLVIFVVSLEVNFYDKYRNYFDSIIHGGRLEDVKSEHLIMVRILSREIAHMLEMQLFVSIFSVSFLANILQKISLDVNMIGIFRVLCFGYCFYGLANAAVIVLLYFDDKKGALISTIIFASISIIATKITINYGIEYYGVGFLIAAFITSVYSLIRMYAYLKRLEYNVFCKQPLFYEEKVGIFTKLEKKLKND